MVTAGIWLLFVLAALWPPFRHGPLGFAAFVMSMAFNELPVLLLGVFVVAMVITGRPDGTTSAVVWAILVAATALGLVWLQLRAGTARRALENGLDRGLGRDWRTAQHGQLPRTPWSRGVLLPFQRRTRGVERVTDLNYGPESAHRVDLYRGSGTSTARPVLIHLHGGGFVSGSKSRESMALLNRLASHGWLCLSADYRLRAEAQHPNPLVDTKRLIAWVREKAGELGADPSQIFLAGCSAGGHLALSAALTPNDAAYQDGFEADETGVAGALVFYGYLGPRSEDASSSPEHLARPDAPPVLIVHGAADTLVSVGSARAVADAVGRTSHNPVVFVELPHTQHSFDRFASVRSRTAASAAEAFLDWALLGLSDARADTRR